MASSAQNKNFKEFCVESAELSGMNVIEASAGTGKTYNLSRIFLRFILEKKLAVSQILVVTFTKAATSELKERIYTLLQKSYEILSRADASGEFPEFIFREFEIDESHKSILLKCTSNLSESRRLLREAVQNFDESSIFTIHGFCGKILSEHAFETGMNFDHEIVSDDILLAETFIKNAWRKYAYSQEENILKFSISEGLFYSVFESTVRDFIYSDAAQAYDIYTLNALDPAIYEEYFHNILQLKNLWMESKSEIGSLFNNGSLNLNIYRKSTIEKIFKSMDEWSASDKETLPDRKEFLFFTETKLKSSIKKDREIPQHEYFSKAQKIYDLRLELTVDLACRYMREAEAVKKHFDDEKIKKSIVSYDDMIQRIYSSLDDADQKFSMQKAIADRFRAALIDEFQDTDKKQWKIFYELFSDASQTLFLIGDPKQSIYRFRGADINSYTESRDVSGMQYTLSKNFRSTQNTLKAIEAIYKHAENFSFSDARGPFLTDQISFHPVQPGKSFDRDIKVESEDDNSFQFLYCSKENAKKFYHLTAGHIASLLESSANGNSGYRLANGELKKIETSDIAVIVNTNSQAFKMQNELRKQNVNSVLYLEMSVFDTGEAVSFHKLLKGLHQPEKMEILSAMLTTNLFCWDAEDIEFLQNEEASVNQIVYEFKKLSSLRSHKGFMFIFQQLLNHPQFMPSFWRQKSCKQRVQTPGETILAMKSGERILMNYMHLAELLQSQSGNSIKEDLIWFRNETMQESFRKDQENKLIRLESDREAVQILTVHKSKGLEFPIIYFPTLWTQSPIKSGGGSVMVRKESSDTGAFVPGFLANILLEYKHCEKYAGFIHSIEDAVRREKMENMQELMRTVYVGLTRPVFRAYIIWGLHTYYKTCPAFYLLHGESFFKEIELQSKRKGEFNIDDLLIGNIKESFPDSQISISLLEEIPDLNYRAIYDRQNLTEPERLQIQKKKSYSMSSYTGLLHNSQNFADHDEYAPAIKHHLFQEKKPEEHKNKNESRVDMFHFETGAAAGIFLHKVLESISFRMTADEILPVVRKLLDQYGYDAALWDEALTEHIFRMLKINLSEQETLKLCEIPDENRIQEMQFLMPVQSALLNADAVPDDPSFELLAKSIDPLHITIDSGFLQGIADLIFIYNDKYYILDWKSNHLGFSSEDYRKENLRNAMIEDSYVLQYYLYTNALNRYLEQTVDAYDYEKHFGGVYYLFLRGMEENKNTGIFYDKPSYQSLAWLDNFLRESGKIL